MSGSIRPVHHAIATFAVHSTDETGEEVIYNEFTAFLRGVGVWGGERGPSGDDVNAPPKREPDAVISETTSANQTLLYRLSGDWNPLHADPSFAKAMGFDKPILHGLCTFGYCGRHVIQAFANNDGRYFKNIKVRFADSVYPGETLETRMWKESDTRIVLETWAKERNACVIKNAAIELYEEIPAAKAKSSGKAEAAPEAQASVEPGARDVVAMLSAYVKEHPELADQIGKVYQWQVEDPDLEFVLDLKNAPGSVEEGSADHDTAITLAESDLMSMMRGETDAQSLYFAGKIQIAGDIMASQKLQFLADMDPKEVQKRLNESMAARGGDAGSSDSGGTDKPGAAAVVAMLSTYVKEHPELTDQVGKVYQWQVSDPDLSFVLDLKNDAGSVYEGTADADTSIDIAEEDLMGLMRGESDAQTLYFAGKIQIGGDIMASQKLQFLADMDPKEVAAALEKATSGQASGTADKAASKPKSKSKPKREPIAPALFSKLAEQVAANKQTVKSIAGHVLQFNLAEPDAAWTLDFSGDTPSLTEGSNDQADAVLGISDADLEALVKGEASIRNLHQHGQLRVDGDIRLAREIGFLKELA